MYITLPGIINLPSLKTMVLQLFRYGPTKRTSETIVMPISVFECLGRAEESMGTCVDLQHGDEIYTLPDISHRQWSRSTSTVHGGDAIMVELQSWTQEFPRELSLCSLEVFDTLEANEVTENFKVSMLSDSVDDIPTKADLELCKTYEDAYILMLAAIPALEKHQQEVLSLYMEFCLKLKDFNLGNV